MTKVLGSIAVTIVVFLMTGSAVGQSGSTGPSGQSCQFLFNYVAGSGSATGGLGSPLPFPTGTRCFGECGPFCTSCVAQSPACTSAQTPSEVCIACLLNALAKSSTPQAGAPIDLATGNTYIVQGDLSVPGLGGGLSLARTWNSKLPAIQNGYSSMFGPRWRSTYEERLIFNSPDNYLKYARSDGSVWSFGVVSLMPNIYRTAAPANDTTTITTTADANGVATLWTLVSKSGEKRTFDPTTG
jgi:hypothetical protein